MLEVLEVIGCGKLRYIIKVENSDNTSAGPVLQNLKQISVKSCGNMKCIMPISVASGLLQLEILEIEDAAKLQYVFGKDNLEKDQNQNQSIDHPSMKIFKLINLPIIISICPQNYHIMWQLDEQLVMRCPKWRDRSYLYSETSQQGGEKATKLNCFQCWVVRTLESILEIVFPEIWHDQHQGTINSTLSLEVFTKKKASY